MNMKEPRQQAIHTDMSDDNDCKIRAERAYRLLEVFQQQASDDERKMLADVGTNDEELNTLQDYAWIRAENELFSDAPTFTSGDSNTGFRIPTAPMRLMAEVAGRFDAGWSLDKVQAETHEEKLIRNVQASARTFRAVLALENIDEKLLGEQQYEGLEPPYPGLKSGKALALAAKDKALTDLDSLSRFVDSHELINPINTILSIYTFTILSGKKALNYRVADQIKVTNEKYIAEAVADDDDEVLKQLVYLMMKVDPSDDEKVLMHQLVSDNPKVLKVAMVGVASIFVNQALVYSAKNGFCEQLSNSMEAYINSRLGDRIATPEENARYLERICELAGIDLSTEQPLETSEPSIDTQSDYSLKPMELDWEVLPPGEAELEKGARRIIHDIIVRTGKQPEIDLDRLNILEGIRELWGKDKSYYSRGTRTKRSVVRDENGQEQPDEYIILVLQELDHETGTVRETAVAESPIVGPNALYVYRPDATDHHYSWREVMALPKNVSRGFGARELKHTTPQGTVSQNDVMIEKTFHLLTVDAANFAEIQFNGLDKAGNVKLRRSIGHSADQLTRDK